MLRIIAFPFDLLSYLSGVFRLPFKKFWIASLLGSFPFTFISLTAGSAFYGKDVHSFEELSENIDYVLLVMALTLLFLFLFGVQILKYFLKKRKEQILEHSVL